jgi:NAD-dependent dihydropyrimidine dehydrogenase PreA subunit
MIEMNYGPVIDYEICDGCGQCYEYCPMDIFGWDKEKQVPTIAHPAECRVCCVCETVCPQLAIDVRIPLHARIDFGIYPKKD